MERIASDVRFEWREAPRRASRPSRLTYRAVVRWGSFRWPAPPRSPTTCDRQFAAIDLFDLVTAFEERIAGRAWAAEHDPS
jgi:hypothetical protein